MYIFIHTSLMLHVQLLELLARLHSCWPGRCIFVSVSLYTQYLYRICTIIGLYCICKISACISSSQLGGSIRAGQARLNQGVYLCHLVCIVFVHRLVCIVFVKYLHVYFYTSWMLHVQLLELRWLGKVCIFVQYVNIIYVMYLCGIFIVFVQYLDVQYTGASAGLDRWSGGVSPCTQSQYPINRETGYSNVLGGVSPRRRGAP